MVSHKTPEHLPESQCTYKQAKNSKPFICIGRLWEGTTPIYIYGYPLKQTKDMGLLEKSCSAEPWLSQIWTSLQKYVTHGKLNCDEGLVSMCWFSRITASVCQELAQHHIVVSLIWKSESNDSKNNNLAEVFHLLKNFILNGQIITKYVWDII